MIDIMKLSPSAAAKVDDCEMKYYISDTLGFRDEAGKAAALGVCLHKIMEVIALGKLHHQNTGERKFIQRLMDNETIIGQYEFDMDSWLKPGTVKIDNKSVKIDGKQFLLDIFELVYTYYANKFSEQGWSDEDHTKIRGWIYTCVTEQDCNYDPRKRKVIQPEQYISLKLKEDWATYDYGDGVTGQFKLNGVIDIIYEIDGNHYEVVDYKTGATRKDWATGKIKDVKSLAHDFQLETYYLMVNELFPKVEHFTITIFYIVAGGPFKPFFYKERLDDIKQKVKKYFKRIQSITQPAMLHNQQKHWKCQKLCPFFKRIHGNDNLCMAVHKMIKEKGIERVTEEMRQ